MNKLKREEKGITLIALVVTIVVLLILAGVTISILAGENGIIQKSIEAKQKTQEGEENEKQLLAQYEQILNNGKILEDDDEELIDDNWVIWKDINTRTSRVNVYLETTYYKPDFYEFFAKDFAIYVIKQGYGINFYDSVDASDFMIDCMMLPANETNRKELEEHLGTPGMNELEKYIAVSYSYGVLDQNFLEEEMNEEEQKQVILDNLYKFGEDNVMDTETLDLFLEKYNQIVTEYDQLYGNVKEMTQKQKEKNYEIILPNGRNEVLTGEQLTKYRIRYSVNKNGSYPFIIKYENGTQTGYNIEIGNIENYWIEIGDYIYTYNCVPTYPTMSYSSWNTQKNQVEDLKDVVTTDYRLNLGGWNVCLKDNTKNEREQFLEQINGEDVTAMIATFAERSFSENEEIVIPEKIKTMFYTFSYADIGNVKNSTIIIPDNVESMLDMFTNATNISKVNLAFEKLEGVISRNRITTYNNAENFKCIFLLDNSNVSINESWNIDTYRWHYDKNNEFAETEKIDVNIDDNKIYLKNIANTNNYNDLNDIEENVYLKIENQAEVDITECVSENKKYIGLQNIIDKGFITAGNEYNATIRIIKPNEEVVTWTGTINF